MLNLRLQILSAAVGLRVCSCYVFATLLQLAFAHGVVTGAEPPIGPDEARPHVAWQDAEKVVGRTAFVYGEIVKVGHAQGIHFLNFDPNRRDVFKVVVFDRALQSFNGKLEELYQGKIVRVRGIVSRYAGVPQIEVNSQDQLQVLPQMPTLPPLAPQVIAEARNEIVIATFNVRNLFDDLDSPERPDELTPAKPRAELDSIAQTIRRLDADVLALQEVEDRDYLARCVDVLLKDLGYEHIVHYEGNDLRGIDVCLLSRLPVGAVTSHRHAEFQDQSGRRQRFSRDVLQVQIEPKNSSSFEVWLVHLKSNADGRQQAEPIRLAEALQVRKLLDKQLAADPAARVVVCGDFNDGAESAALKAIVGSESSQLRSGYQTLPTDRRITFNREPYRSMIDFVLWTPAMDSWYVPASYRIVDDEDVALGSDHNPVLARFRLK